MTIQSGLESILTDGDYYYVMGGNTDVFRGPIAGGVATKVGSSGLITDFAGSDGQSVYALVAFTHGGGFSPGAKPVSFPK